MLERFLTRTPPTSTLTQTTQTTKLLELELSESELEEIHLFFGEFRTNRRKTVKRASLLININIRKYLKV